MTAHQVKATPPSRSNDHVAVYWPHIDGLRAIAILLVVGFHARLPQLPGGFVGVDIFFVISGYLITGLLMAEINRTGRIDLWGFYARRARRLLPALAVVLVATLLGGTTLLLPFGEQQELAKSAIAASAFLANIYFWRTRSDYFAGPAEEIPLLHLWTLAVEEQFYIVWPLVIVAIVTVVTWQSSSSITRTKLLIVALAAATLLSFLACAYLTPRRWTLVFYNMPFRAWEFGVGAVIALVAVRSVKSRLAQLGAGFLAAAGVVAIAIACTVFDSGTLFPGTNAALPVLGAGAIILALRLAPQSLVGRTLALPPMAAIGKLSYSWYLWHWPLLALARANAMGETSLLHDLALVGFALILSAITYVLVEEPIRRRKPWPFSAAALSVAAGIALMLMTASSAGLLWAKGEARMAGDATLTAAKRALEEKVSQSTDCGNFQFEFAGLPPREKCTLGSQAVEAPLYLLWGDSHAFHFIPALSGWAQQAGTRLLPRASGACKPYMTEVTPGLDGKQLAAARNCIAYNQAVLAELSALKAEGATHVILAARWSVPSELQKGLGNWAMALRETVAHIRSVGLEVVLLAEVPQPEHRVPQCVARHGSEACARPRQDVDSERADALTILSTLARDSVGVRMVDIVDELCSQKTCRVAEDGIVTYSDDSHLSLAASTRLSLPLGHQLVRSTLQK